MSDLEDLPGPPPGGSSVPPPGNGASTLHLSEHITRAPLAAGEDEDEDQPDIAAAIASGLGGILHADLDQINDNLADYPDDNLSLEVNFGDGSSCHASDVSSISFQNIVLDDIDAENMLYNRPVHDFGYRHGGGARDSISESSDSPLNDFPPAIDDDACLFSGRLEEQIKRQHHQSSTSPQPFHTPSSSSISPSNTTTHASNEEESDKLSDSADSYNTGTMKRKNKQFSLSHTNDPVNPLLDCDGGGSCCDESTNPKQPCFNGHGCPDTLQVDENPKNGERLDLTIEEAAAAATTTTQVRETVSKRNSLEVRNNIPDLAIVKNYDSDSSSRPVYQSQGAVPKMRKKSPGLARRLPDGTVELRDTSSSEKELDNVAPPIDTTVVSAQEEFETKLRNGSLPMYPPGGRMSSLERKEKQIQDFLDSQAALFKQDNDHNNATGATQHMQPGSSRESSASPERISSGSGTLPGQPANSPNAADVENEYDYVKYARVQSGDSYVGMRLAYSSSNDSLNLRRSWSGMRSSDDEHYLASSREGSPEKQVIPLNQQGQQRMSKVNEDTLTEIPLNGSDHLHEPEQKNFSLSPEPTECDSAEVESVLSDEGKSSTSGMPMVEDGLSSSQGSDTEDPPSGGPSDMHRPAEILKRRHKQDVELELQQQIARLEEIANIGERSSFMTDNSSQKSSEDSDGTRLKKDAMDIAMKEMQSARRYGRSKEEDNNRQGQEDGDPVWIMRYVENDLQKISLALK